MNIYDIVFYLFAAITVLSAFFVVTSRNIVYSAYYLLFTFFGVAGIYVLLGADFIAMVQLIVYVGGILILLLFGVMLTNNVEIKTGSVQTIPSAVGVALLAGILMASMIDTKWRSVETAMPSATTHGIGMLLIQQYAVVFELLGILLLIALIGAASMARK